MPGKPQVNREAEEHGACGITGFPQEGMGKAGQADRGLGVGIISVALGLEAAPSCPVPGPG